MCGQVVRTLEGHTNNVNALAVSVDGRYLFSGSSDYTVRQWLVETGEVGVTPALVTPLLLLTVRVV